MNRQTITLVEALRAVVEPGSKVRWDRQHGERHRCVLCGKDCMNTAVVDLCYTFEVCTCGDPSYDHIVEQLWHRQCHRIEIRDDAMVGAPVALRTESQP